MAGPHMGHTVSRSASRLPTGRPVAVFSRRSGDVGSLRGVSYSRSVSIGSQGTSPQQGATSSMLELDSLSLFATVGTSVGGSKHVQERKIPRLAQSVHSIGLLVRSMKGHVVA